eukprot:3372455-Pleurochrysis_carterae.AAC.1
MRLTLDGHLQIVQDLELFQGPSIDSSAKRFSVGLQAEDDTKFAIRDEVRGEDVLVIDAAGVITANISGLS